MNDLYSPHTGEYINGDTPAPWMGRAGVACPAHDQATQCAFWRGGPAWVIEDVTPTVIVPRFVTPAQGGIALINADLMSPVQAVIDALRSDPAADQTLLWTWDKATEWDRESPSLIAIAAAAGITDQQMDSLFIAAAQIVA